MKELKNRLNLQPSSKAQELMDFFCPVPVPRNLSLAECRICSRSSPAIRVFQPPLVDQKPHPSFVIPPPSTLGSPRSSHTTAPKLALPLTASAAAHFGLWTLSFGLRSSSPAPGRSNPNQSQPIRGNPNLNKIFFPRTLRLGLRTSDFGLFHPMRPTATNFDY